MTDFQETNWSTNKCKAQIGVNCYSKPWGEIMWCVSVCVCLCVCDREREREVDRHVLHNCQVLEEVTIISCSV